MNFLNPLFLFSLAAVAIPLVVHIFSVKRVPELRFSTLMFLKKSQRRSMRRVDLRRLLLLALRMILVALVALSFARPVIRGEFASLFPGSEPAARMILIDRSYSMAFETDAGPLIGLAADAARRILSRAGDDDLIMIYALDDRIEPVYEVEGRGRGFAVDAIGGIETSWKPADLRGGLAAALKILGASERTVKELYVISDFQKSSLPEGFMADTENGGGLGNRGPGEEVSYRAFLVPVRDVEAPGMAITGVSVRGVAVRPGDAVDIEIGLMNTSKRRAAATRLSVFSGGERLINRQVKAEPAEKTLVKESFVVGGPGWIDCEARVDGDRLRYDDRRFFVINVIDRIRLMYLGAEEDNYLRHAVKPKGSQDGVEVREAASGVLTSADIEGCDVVIAAPGADIQGGDALLIRDFILSGGGAVIFARPAAQRFIQKISSHSPAFGSRGSGNSQVSLALSSGDSPFLSPFSADDLRGLSALRFRDEAEVKGVPPSKAILSFKDGSPFIWRESVGEGSVVFIACDPTLSGGELVISPYFVPLVHQAILAAAGKEGAGKGVNIGDDFLWRGMAGEGTAVSFRGISDPGEDIGVSESVELSWKDTKEGVRVGAPGEPGYISIMKEGRVLARVGVNPECSRESDLSYMEAGEAADSLGLEQYAVVEPGDGFEARVKEAAEGKEVTAAFMIAALVVFIIECFVAQKAGIKG